MGEIEMKPKPVVFAVVVFVLALVSCGDDAEVLGSGLNAPAPVVIDSDMGADDMMALIYLLGIDSVSVEAVTVTGNGLAHCPEGGINARAVLAHVGSAGVPVACGPSEPLSGTNAFPDEWREGAVFLAARLGLGVPGSVDTGAPERMLSSAARQMRSDCTASCMWRVRSRSSVMARSI